MKAFIIKMSSAPTSMALSNIELAAYEDILAQETQEEYGDIKSKAEFE